MAFIAPESRRSVDSRFGRLAVNVCRIAVQSVVERLRLVGLESPDPIWDEFLAWTWTPPPKSSIPRCVFTAPRSC